MSEAMPCPDSCPCLALSALGYYVVRTPGSIFHAIALPNSQTLRLKAGAWIAVPSTSSGFGIDETRAVAVDRGGTLL